MIRMVQISDIHFKYSDYDTKDLREKLLVKMSELKAVSYLVLSGDFLYKYSDNLNETADFINSLRTKLGIKRKDVFMCPGNHDVDRTYEFRNQLIEEIRKKTEGGKKPVKISSEDYNALSAVGHDNFAKLHWMVTKRNFTPYKVITRAESKCNFILLDTALLSKDKEDTRKLSAAYPVLNSYKLRPDLLNIVVMHHGVDYFDEAGERSFQHWADDKSIDMVLCGHSHRAGVRTYEDTRNGIKQFTCGAPLIDGDAVPSFFVYDFDEKSWTVDAQLYTYSNDCHNWIIDNHHLRAFTEGHYVYHIPRKYDRVLKEKSLIVAPDSEESREASHSSRLTDLSAATVTDNAEDIMRLHRELLSSIEEAFHKIYGFHIISSRFNSEEDFSAAKLLQSLIEIGMPTDRAILVLNNVIKNITATDYVQQNGDKLTTGTLRNCIYKEICNLPEDIAESVASDVINGWATRYARKYGHNNRRTEIVKDDKLKIFDLNLATDDILADLIMNVTGSKRYYETLTRREITEMGLEIKEFIRSCEMYRIEYNALMNFIIEIAVEPPHPWMFKDEGRTRFLAYNAEVLQKHTDTIEKHEEDKITMLETLYHSTALFLGMYSNMIGTSETSPLRLFSEAVRSLTSKEGYKGNIPEENVKDMLRDLNSVGIAQNQFIKYVTDAYHYVIIRNDLNSNEARQKILTLRNAIIQVYNYKINSKSEDQNSNTPTLGKSAKESMGAADVVNVPGGSYNTINIYSSAQEIQIQQGTEASFQKKKSK